MTRRPKGKLFALLAIFVAIGLVTASGAFSSVVAERTATVSTAGDGSADALRFQVNSSSSIAQLGGNSGNELTFSASGINENATTNYGYEFNITYPDITQNQGRDITFYIADEKSELHAAIDSDRLTLDNDSLEFTNMSSDASLEGDSNAVTLSPGDTINVSITVNTTKGNTISGLDESGTILFVANSTSG